MAERKTDLRVVKTKHAIHSALAKLMAQRDLNDITVKALAETARINRKTFYNYYAGIYEVVDEIENDIAGKLEAVTAEMDAEKLLEEPNEFFDRITDVIYSDLEFYGNLLRIPGSNSLIEKLASIFADRLRQALAARTSLSGVQIDVTVRFFLSGLLSVYQSWFLAGADGSIGDISDVLGTLTIRGLNGLLQEEKGKAPAGNGAIGS